MMEDPTLSSPHSYVERENPEESLDPLYPKELLEMVEISLDEPPTRRIFVSCQDIL